MFVGWFFFIYNQFLVTLTKFYSFFPPFSRFKPLWYEIWPIKSCLDEKTTIYGIKSAVRRFLFKIRDIPTKTKGKKSAAWWRFFYRVKKATIVPLFLPFRFFYRVFAFFTCTFFGIVGGKYETINVPMLTSNHTCTLHCALYVYCLSSLPIWLLHCLSNLPICLKNDFFLKSCCIYVCRKSSPGSVRLPSWEILRNSRGIFVARNKHHGVNITLPMHSIN